MPEQVPTEFFRWYVTDQRTGKRRLTRHKMKREDAPPGAEPDLRSREVRLLDPPGTPPELRKSGAL